jgi:hypothetical protein
MEFRLDVPSLAGASFAPWTTLILSAAAVADAAEMS